MYFKSSKIITFADNKLNVAQNDRFLIERRNDCDRIGVCTNSIFPTTFSKLIMPQDC